MRSDKQALEALFEDGIIWAVKEGGTFTYAVADAERREEKGKGRQEE